MHQHGGARIGGGARDIGSAFRLHVFKGLALLEQDAGQVDDGVRALDRRGHAVSVGDIAFHEIDLADRAQRTQEKAPPRIAGRHPDAPAGTGQRPHRMTAQKAGTAENRDQIRAHAPSIPNQGSYMKSGAPRGNSGMPRQAQKPGFFPGKSGN